uniref:Uncharacterized protein n=1 Tax=Loigolactobacillus rennini TaxID=238013 RepID=A0A1K2I7T1_9LACO|nr:hypothetical protein LREN565_1396 [Loigolactobacillus rennini]
MQPYKTILVGLDASQAAQFAFKKAGLEFLVLESISIPKVLGPF